MPSNSLNRILATFSILLFCSVVFSNSIILQPNTNEAAGIDLSDLRESGYRLDWMNQSNANGLHLPTIIGDSVYTVDSQDYLTRYDKNSGKWLWSSPIGNQIFELHGISEFEGMNRVYVISDGAIYVLEKATGNFPTNQNTSSQSKAKQKQVLPLEWVASTSAQAIGNDLLVYGSNNGNLIWFNPTIGFDINRYRIGNAIRAEPTLATGIQSNMGLTRKAIIATSTDGYVSAVDLNQITTLWSFKLTSPVETKTTFGSNSTVLNDEEYVRTSVFIAGGDQYLRAVDLHTGKQRWNALLSKKLVDAPVFLQSKLYQQIPGVGLACYDAFPDDLSGKQLWLADDVHGNVMTTTADGQLVCWDNQNSVLQIVDSRKGGIVSALQLPVAKIVLADNKTQGSLYLITHDDAILRLVPRH